MPKRRAPSRSRTGSRATTGPSSSLAAISGSSSVASHPNQRVCQRRFCTPPRLYADPSPVTIRYPEASAASQPPPPRTRARNLARLSTSSSRCRMRWSRSIVRTIRTFIRLAWRTCSSATWVAWRFAMPGTSIWLLINSSPGTASVSPRRSLWLSTWFTYSRVTRATFLRVPSLVGSHSHLDELFEGRVIGKAATPSRLARAASEPAIPWEFQGEALTLDAYFNRNPTTGLLIARGETILVERYQYDRHDRHRFTSWSMAKTVTSMLMGIAIAEGRIRSVDEPAAAYVPALEGTEYGRTSLRHLLQMSSGVRFVEDYSGNDDVMKLARATFAERGGPPRHRLPGRKDLAPDGRRGRRHVARRPLGPGGDILLHQRSPARLRASGALARARGQLARPTAHPRRVDQGRHYGAWRSSASPPGDRDGLLRLRLSDVDLPGCA